MAAPAGGQPSGGSGGGKGKQDASRVDVDVLQGKGGPVAEQHEGVAGSQPPPEHPEIKEAPPRPPQPPQPPQPAPRWFTLPSEISEIEEEGTAPTPWARQRRVVPSVWSDEEEEGGEGWGLRYRGPQAVAEADEKQGPARPMIRVGVQSANR